MSLASRMWSGAHQDSGDYVQQCDFVKERCKLLDADVKELSRKQVHDMARRHGWTKDAGVSNTIGNTPALGNKAPCQCCSGFTAWVGDLHARWHGPKMHLPNVMQRLNALPEHTKASGESLEWLNYVIRRLWPKVNQAICKKVKSALTPLIQEKLPTFQQGFSFERMSLGDCPPRFGSMHVLRHGSFIELRVRVEFDSDGKFERDGGPSAAKKKAGADIVLNAVMLRLCIQRVSFDGELSLRFKPLMDEFPVAGGIVIAFLNAPKIKLDFRVNAGNSASHFLTGIVDNVLKSALSNSLVYPNVKTIFLPGNTLTERRRMVLSNPKPLGVLRVTCLSASNLVADDWNFFRPPTSDPYVLLEVGSDSWRSVSIKRTCWPVWKQGNTHDFLVFDCDQEVHLSVWDEDMFGPDNPIGMAKKFTVADALQRSEQDIPLTGFRWDFDESSDDFDCGSVRIKFDWCCLKQGDFWATDAVVVAVQIYSVSLPRWCGIEAGICASIGTTTKSTPIHTYLGIETEDKQVKQYKSDVARRCHGAKIDRDTIQQISGMESRDLDDIFSSVPDHAEGEHATKNVTNLIHMRRSLYLQTTKKNLEEDVLTLTLINRKRKMIGKLTEKFNVGSAEEDDEQQPTSQRDNISTVKDAREYQFTADNDGQTERIYAKLSFDPLWVHEDNSFLESDFVADESVEEDDVQTRSETTDHKNHISVIGNALDASSRFDRSVSARGSVCWINMFMAEMWPHIDKAVSKYVKDNVEPILQNKVPHAFKGIHFERFSLGTNVPELLPVEVYWESNASKDNELKIPIHYEGNADVSINVLGLPIGLKSLSFRGDFLIRFDPILDELPVIGGIVMSFLDCPILDLDMTGLATVCGSSVLSGILRSTLNNAIAEKLVLPNVISKQIGKPIQGVDLAALHTPCVEGVLRVTAVRAANLPATDWHFFSRPSSDPYLCVRLADDQWRTPTVTGSCNPRWPADCRHDFLVYDIHQSLMVEVYDEDTGKPDDYVGRSKPMPVFEALEAQVANGSSHPLPIKLFPTEAKPLDDGSIPQHGTVYLRVEWFKIVPQVKQGDWKDFIVQVVVRDVWMPEICGTEARLSARIGETTKTSPVRKIKDKTSQLATEQRKVALRCQERKISKDKTAVIADIDQRRVKQLSESWGRCGTIEDLGTKIHRLPLQCRLHLPISRAQLHNDTCEIALVTKNLTPIATAKFNLVDLKHSHDHSVSIGDGVPLLVCTDGQVINGNISVSLLGLHRGAMDSNVKKRTGHTFEQSKRYDWQSNDVDTPISPRTLQSKGWFGICNKRAKPPRLEPDSSQFTGNRASNFLSKKEPRRQTNPL